VLKPKDYPEVLIVEILAFQGLPLKLRDILFFGITLARESAAKQIEGGQVCGVDFCGVGIVFLLLSDVVDGAVAGVGVFVDLAVADAPETARAGQPGPEAADAREHIKVTDQGISPSFFFEAYRKPGTCHPRPQPAVVCFVTDHRSCVSFRFGFLLGGLRARFSGNAHLSGFSLIQAFSFSGVEISVP